MDKNPIEACPYSCSFQSCLAASQGLNIIPQFCVKQQGKGNQNQRQSEENRQLQFADSSNAQLHKFFSKLGDRLSICNHQGNAPKHAAGCQGEHEKIDSRAMDENTV